MNCFRSALLECKTLQVCIAACSKQVFAEQAVHNCVRCASDACNKLQMDATTQEPLSFVTT